jgi:hypothetical protein
MKIPLNCSKCPVCGGGMIMGSCFIFSEREERGNWQENSRRNSYDKFGQKKDGRHL